jgi:hypothetical protein
LTFTKSLKQRLRRAVINPSLYRDLELVRYNQGQILAELNRNKQSANLQDYEFSVYSQWGEDGIIQRLLSLLPIANRTFIEFGVEDFNEANCRFLMAHDHWRGFVLDGSPRWIAKLRNADWFWKYDLRAEHAMVTRDNVNELLTKSGFDRDLGILSIDVDGVDYWLLEAVTAFEPRIIIMEYNALFGPERAITVPYDAAFSRRAKHYSELYFGASLAALEHLARQKGYALVCTESAGVNAFFVRNDLAGGDVQALSAALAYSPTHVRQSRNTEGMLDYLDAKAQYDAIRGMPVINVITGNPETL